VEKTDDVAAHAVLARCIDAAECHLQYYENLEGSYEGGEILRRLGKHHHAEERDYPEVRQRI
jgi:hypothetical protein